MDKLDKALLALMQADASLSVGELSERVNVSKSACWRRIQKLEEAGIRQPDAYLRTDGFQNPLLVQR